MKHSKIVSRVTEYLSYRRSFDLKLRIEGQQLLNFAKFADDSGHVGPITVDLALNWAQLPERGSRLYKARRLEVVRCFAKYEAIFDPKTEIPGAFLLGPAHRRTAPYIYSGEDIKQILVEAGRLHPRNGIRPHTYSTLLGLLVCTGLRISEALRLSRFDFDEERGLLTIRETKFQKSRLVPLHPSAVRQMVEYARLRDKFFKNPKSDTFFLSPRGAIKYSTVRTIFKHVRDRIPKKPGERRRPRLHDLRHRFACQRLLLWHRSGENPENGILALSTYLGHAKVSDTYWYLSGIPELFEIASLRFAPGKAKNGRVSCQ